MLLSQRPAHSVHDAYLTFLYNKRYEIELKQSRLILGAHSGDVPTSEVPTLVLSSSAFSSLAPLPSWLRLPPYHALGQHDVFKYVCAHPQHWAPSLTTGSWTSSLLSFPWQTPTRHSMEDTFLLQAVTCCPLHLLTKLSRAPALLTFLPSASP